MLRDFVGNSILAIHQRS